MIYLVVFLFVVLFVFILIKKNRNKKIKNDFFMTKEIFYDNYLPYYETEPSRIIQFKMILPYYFPIKDYEVITLQDDDAYFSFEFEKKYKNKNYKYDILEKEFPINKAISKIEMTYVEKKKIDNEDEEYISKCFDKSIDKLNEILLAYKVKNKDEKIYMLRKEMLAMTIICRVVTIKDWNEEKLLFVINENFPYDREIMNDEEMQDFLRHCNIVINNINPFINTIDYLINSKRLMNQGFYEDSVINASIAVESYIRNLYRCFLEIENVDMTSEEIDEILEGKNFSGIIKTEMPKRLGGNWNLEREDLEIGNWYKNTYQLRNRIVHGSRKVSFQEVQNSWVAANDVIIYIKSLIIKQKNKYPEIYDFFETN